MTLETAPSLLPIYKNLNSLYYARKVSPLKGHIEVVLHCRVWHPLSWLHAYVSKLQVGTRQVCVTEVGLEEDGNSVEIYLSISLRSALR